MIKVLEFYRNVRREWRLLHNLVSIFQVENVSPGKKDVEYLRHQQISIKCLPK